MTSAEELRVSISISTSTYPCCRPSSASANVGMNPVHSQVHSCNSLAEHDDGEGE